PTNIGPPDPRSGIEIDAKLVRVVEILRAHGVRMQLDAAEVDDPGEPRRIVDHDLFRGTTGRKRQRHRPQPRRSLAGSALLVEGPAIGAVEDPLEQDRAMAKAAERARGDGRVVADEVELRELPLP